MRCLFEMRYMPQIHTPTHDIYVTNVCHKSIMSSFHTCVGVRICGCVGLVVFDFVAACEQNAVIRDAGEKRYGTRPFDCNPLQHSTTHCNLLQHTATLCNTLQHTATHCNSLQLTATHYNTLQHTATLYHTLQLTATHG